MEHRNSIDDIRAIVSALTDRHREILELASRHKSQKQIARQLGISPNTVKTHATEIRRRFDVESMREAVVLYENHQLNAGITPKERPTFEGIALTPRLDTYSRPEAQGLADSHLLDDPKEGFGERDETALRSEEGLSGPRVGGQAAIGHAAKGPLEGDLFSLLAYSKPGTERWIERLSFSELVAVVLVSAVALILFSSIGVTCLIGLFQAVQGFSGQPG